MRSKLKTVIEMMANNSEKKFFFSESKAITSLTYKQIYLMAKKLSDNMQSLGVRENEIICLHGNTSIAWLIVDIACVLSDCVSLALYPNAQLDRIVNTATNSNSRIIFTDNKVVAKEFEDLGYGVFFIHGSHIDAVNSLIPPLESHPDPELSNVFTIVSTSGTLSEPRLFGVSPTPLLETMVHFKDLYSLSGKDKMLLFLPLSHLPQRMIVYGCIAIGMDFFFSTPKNFLKDAIVFQPTITVTVPRILGYICSLIDKEISGNSMVSDKNNDAHELALQSSFGEDIKTIFVGSAPPDYTVLSKLMNWGLPLYEVYGTTELGMVALNYPGNQKLGFTGKAIPWGRVALDSDDELTLQTPTPFLYGFMDGGSIRPYHWGDAFHKTGDIGSIDKGYVKVLCRAKDFVALSNGEKIYVEKLEKELSVTVPTLDVVVVGNGQKNLRVLFIEKKKNQKTDCDFKEVIKAYNQSKHSWEQIHTYYHSLQPLSALDGTLTETLKLRRHIIEEKYKTESQWIQIND